MNKNKFAITPPMGWNSYDYYDTTVNEEQVKKNAQYMAMHFRLQTKRFWSALQKRFSCFGFKKCVLDQ